MSVFDLFNNKTAQIRKLMAAGQTAEQQGDPETAFTHYQQAAELGSADAMVAIGALYAAKNFRPVEQSNLLELMQQGIPVFPWNLQTQVVPDLKTALEWYRKAADRNHPVGCYIAGCMLCDGSGCKADIPQGLAYLEKARKQGVTEADQMYSLFAPATPANLTDAAYEACLAEFRRAVETEDPRRFALYARLKGGTDRQKTRLGYVLTAAQNLNDSRYGLFKYLMDDAEIPLIPACCKRAHWQTFVRIDLNAFSGEDTYLAFSSDIDPRYTLGYFHRLTEAGTARYRSPAFGWLGEEKHAVVLKIDPDKVVPREDLEPLIRRFRLIPAEHEPRNAAFLTECGEKEYSVEIAAIQGDRVDVLFRYTIGGPEDIRESFQPELIDLTLA